ncbi:hypothetical protein G9C85_17145 [Halorubellus sp. JP-L1]|uniref:hypothetical protein n=1 Tax=Halorubellus sp. JP-L1 TaxID=2715753 RepID=UPI00140D8B06|nr:hypothetical protein [Halorubellus sp. JP-L1]NHN43345.1 hypothetical protein [Halorubellus sp. JP-L1]
MSTDSAITVEWTVPDGEAGGDARGRADDAGDGTREVAPAPNSEPLADRETAELPPASVLAARVDHLRSDRDARERELDAVRDRYETILAERNAEIRELRANESWLETLAQRASRFF